MNPNADNDNPGESFDFDAAEHQFEDVKLPRLGITPAERQIVKQIESGFETLEAGLRYTLANVEACREIDWEAVMADPEKTESVCTFSEVVLCLPHGLAGIAVATLAARHEFVLDQQDDDLSEAA